MRNAASETRVDPSSYVIKKVFDRIGILPWKLFARYAWCDSMFRSFNNDKILVGTCCYFVVDFIVADEIVCPHSTDKDRD